MTHSIVQRIVPEYDIYRHADGSCSGLMTPGFSKDIRCHV